MAEEDIVTRIRRAVASEQLPLPVACAEAIADYLEARTQVIAAEVARRMRPESIHEVMVSSKHPRWTIREAHLWNPRTQRLEASAVDAGSEADVRNMLRARGYTEQETRDEHGNAVRDGWGRFVVRIPTEALRAAY